MLKFLSIFLSVQLLFSALMPSMHMDDIVKIPALIEHYNQHEQQDSELGFADFLMMHYADKHQDESGHEKLPFKQHNPAPAMLSVQPVIPVLDLASNNILILKLPPKLRAQLISNHTNSIWQPPRLS